MRFEFGGRIYDDVGGRVSRTEEVGSLLVQSPGVLRLLPLCDVELEGVDMTVGSAALTKTVLGETAESRSSASVPRLGSGCGSASDRPTSFGVRGG
jgi:hypothetical protein